MKNNNGDTTDQPSRRKRPRVAGGVLMWRRREGELQVLLAHPGGPYFVNKDDGHWTIPKGEPDEGESLEQAAPREFEEELGLAAPSELVALGTIRQKGGKVVHAWAGQSDTPDGWEPASNEFEIEWPPRSGERARFPEVDRAEWFSLQEARAKIKDAQIPLIDRIEAAIRQADGE